MFYDSVLLGRTVSIEFFWINSPAAQWVKRWPTDLGILSSSSAEGEIF